MKEKSYAILFLGRIFVGLVFAYTGFTKVVEPVENFQAAMAAYEVIPSLFIPVLSWVVPWVELVFGFFLIVGYLPRVSAGVLALMSWSFILLILSTRIVTGSLPKDCGCFGEGSLIHLTPIQVVILDICNTLIGIKLVFTQKHPFSLESFLK